MLFLFVCFVFVRGFQKSAGPVGFARVPTDEHVDGARCPQKHHNKRRLYGKQVRSLKPPLCLVTL